MPIAKSASKKIGALIFSIKFLCLEVALYIKFYNTAMHEYCCPVWTGAPSCDLELLDKLQEGICRAVGPSLIVSLEPLPQLQNVASVSL